MQKREREILSYQKLLISIICENGEQQTAINGGHIITASKEIS